jgi:hypothetical protein
LEAIYARYYDTFAAYPKEGGDRRSKVFVPVDLRAVAAELGVDGDIVFGRLYFHLDPKFRYKKAENTFVSLFEIQVGGERHCVNFPLLASALASLRAEHLRFRLATSISLFSLALAAAALAVSIANTFWLKTGTSATPASQGKGEPSVPIKK